jgi:hypothetical protein
MTLNTCISVAKKELNQRQAEGQQYEAFVIVRFNGHYDFLPLHRAALIPTDMIVAFLDLPK